MEKIVNKFVRLFEVRLLHHYWLDEATVIFDNFTTPAQKTNRLLEYDCRPFLSVEPTKETIERLGGLKCLFIITRLGFVVVTKEGTIIPPDAKFEFVVKIIQSDFFNYTVLTLQKRNTYELIQEGTNQIYRYKEGVFTFSNQTGTEKAGTLFLSHPIPALGTGPYKAETMIDVGGDLFQNDGDTSNDPPGAGWRKVASLNAWPIYVHQGDVEIIVPPTGLVGVPPHGIELKPELPNEIFALIRIETLATGNPFGLYSAPSIFSEPAFEIRFRNRSVFHETRSLRTGSLISTSAVPLTMAYHGNTGAGPKPNQGIKPQLNPAEEIAKIISEIFV